MKSLKAVLLAACGVVMTFATLVVSKPPTAMAAGGCCSYTSECSTGETCCPGTGGAAPCSPDKGGNYCKKTSTVGDCNC